MPRVLRLMIAFSEVLLSHSAILCYFAMVLNTLMSGSIISMLFPISIFFWAMLSVPRPKKSYWVTVITYTEVCFTSLISVVVSLCISSEFNYLFHYWLQIVIIVICLFLIN